MAPHLHPRTRGFIHFLLSYGFPPKVIATQARCSPRAVRRIQREDPIEMARGRRSRVGRWSCISEPMRNFLSDTLDREPDLYFDEMADLLYEEFGGKVSARSIGQALRSID